MSESRECPLCGEMMRLHSREEVSRVPGTGEVRTRTTEEWVCPECDYFQERDPDEKDD